MENSLVNRDKQVIWHPYTPQKHAPDPIPIVKGEGVYLIDTAGKAYIDTISSWWVNLHGHAHPYIAKKIYEQALTLEQVIFAGFTHEPAVRLAERIIPILPGDFSKIFYSDNGSTAVEVAIKMAVQYWWNGRVGGHESGVGSRESGGEDIGYGMRNNELNQEAEIQYPQLSIQNLESNIQHPASSIQHPAHHSIPRNKILALKNSYHGDTFGAMSVSDRGIFTLAFQDKLFEVIFVDLPIAGDTGTHTEKNVGHSPIPANLHEFACFIYEPLVQGAGGMKMHSAEALDHLLKICREHGIICIADEVMTGFGRTGKLFASEYMRYKPDIICLSKGLTGGSMALGITACTERIHAAFVSEDKLKTFFHGHSFTANPLACSAALASLDLLQKEDCRSSIERIALQHQAFLKKLENRNSNSRTKNHRQLGTILAFELITEDRDEYLNDVRSIIIQKALLKGVFIRPLGNTVYLMPPYCITQTELEKVYDTLTEILGHL